MKEIILKQHIALVSDEDFEWLNQFEWYWFNGYAVRFEGLRRFAMHREIIIPNPGMVVDHKNQNRLDNRRENLRECTQSENSRNTKMRVDNKSGYRGVRSRRHGNSKRLRWEARISANGSPLHLGYFNNPEDAARAYDIAAKKYHGKFASLNFKNPPD